MRVPSIALLGLATLTGPGQAKVAWVVSTAPYLEARSNESEADASLRAICRNSSAVELRVGAYNSVGKGQGESVVLHFNSQVGSAVLRGVSRKSEDYEMTGGTELVTEIPS